MKKSQVQKYKYIPTAKQMIFLTCPADEVFYGGARGGGKSFALGIAAIGESDQNFFNNKNWSSLILRRTYGESESTLIKRLRIMIGDDAKYDANKHRFSSPQGGMIQFGHIKNDSDIYKYQGAEYNRICFDELTHFTEDMYMFVQTSLRTTDPNLKCRVFAGSNPGGMGHQWVKKRFIDIGEENKIHVIRSILPNGKEYVRTRAFIPSGVYDNPYLMKNDPQYVQRLMDQPEIWRKAFLDGDWNIFAGQFFREFTNDHICDPFTFPDFWKVWVAMDYGHQTKCSIGFYTQDPDTGVFYRFDELYVSKMGPDDLSDAMRNKLGNRVKNVVSCYGDRRIMVKDEFSVSTQEKFALNGFHFQLAVDNRVEGWYRCREVLMPEKDGAIKFKVFSNCKNFIELIPQMIHDDRNPEDINRNCESHIADEFRYFSMMRKPANGVAEIVADDFEYSPVTGYIGGMGEVGRLRDKIHIQPLGWDRDKYVHLRSVA